MGDPLHELLLPLSACPDPVRPASLSAADLHACLQRLRQRSEEVKTKVRGLVTALSDVDKSVDDVAPLAAEIPRLLERLLPGIALGNGGVCEELAVEDDKDSPAAGSRLASEVGLKATATAGTTITDGVADIESSTSTSTTITTSSSSSFADACFPPSVSAIGGDISATARNARRVKRELREIEDSIETVEMVVGVHEVLTMIDKSLLRGEIVDAARAVVRLERAIIRAGVKREADGKDDDDDDEEEEEERVLENVGEEEVGLVVLSEGRGEGALASGAPSSTVAVIEQVASERGDGGQQQAKEREERHSEKAEEEIRVFGILRSEFSLRKTKLKGILESLFRRALVIDRIHCELRWMPIVQLFRRHSGSNSGQISGTDLNDTDVDVGFGDILDALEVSITLS
ncbi:hypothetical protein CBR_g3450 [Chara braunii]|uniref:Uncharacterized protein n=1 Tax=Chara braunii TaxID=69332 RepID=A0A388JQW1_CHABU|nr:hypothetical protein CBR_g3450 [Chara braunii]|eukprot:GBG60206.1 hypothetical protein CBR_g3450 [Chara braunii]